MTEKRKPLKRIPYDKLLDECPYSITFGDRGNTVIIFPNSQVPLWAFSQFVSLLGDPDAIGCAGDFSDLELRDGEYDPDALIVSWPHQDLPDKVYELMERINTQDTLKQIGYYKIDVSRKKQRKGVIL